MNDTLVVIPTYNEAEAISIVAFQIFRADPAVDILFVDDDSPDGTGQLADRMAAADPRINVLHRPKKEGLGRAYIAGFRWALARPYEFVFEMDADLSHNPADIPRFLGMIQHHDLVLGSRYINGVNVINWPLNRLILSKCASYYTQLITRMPFSDPTGGYKCFRRSLLEKIDLDSLRSTGYSFQIEMTYRAWRKHCSIAELPIIFSERRSGTSKMNKSIILEALWMIWKLRINAYKEGNYDE